MDFNFSSEKNLLKFLPEIDGQSFVAKFLDDTLFHPLNDFVARPGKGVRSQLVMLGYTSCKPNSQFSAMKICCQIIEALHLGSLIIDDIQDDSKERRQGPSFHLTIGMPKAINSGTWLYFWALKQVQELPLNQFEKLNFIEAINKCLFVGHLGQALDIGRPITEIARKDIREFCRATSLLKSGALAGLALQMGAIASKAKEKLQNEFYEIGCALGLLLQHYDDLKNLKISTRKNIEFDKKSFEDLMNARPNCIWSFAAEHCDKKEFSALKLCLEKLPVLDELAEWQQRNHFHETSLQQLQEQTQSLLKKCEQLQENFELETSFTNQISSVVKILEQAYVEA